MNRGVSTIRSWLILSIVRTSLSDSNNSSQLPSSLHCICLSPAVVWPFFFFLLTCSSIFGPRKWILIDSYELDTCGFFISFQEHHLLKAISARQKYGDIGRTDSDIPIPDVLECVEEYVGIYRNDATVTKNYIHVPRESHCIFCRTSKF